MARLCDVVQYCDELLQISQFKDYCPNGLQIEGRPEVARLATAVTASMRVIEQAVEWEADLLVVHHGYFWKNESTVIVGMKRQRIAAMLSAGMSLLAYHLPLDAHPVLGNNAQLGQRLGISSISALFPQESQCVGNIGELPEGCTIDQFIEQLESSLQRKALWIAGGPASIHRIAWCTGAAQHMIEQAVAMGADVYVSGEISEQTVHVARECGIHYLAAGHHATERYGVQALGNDLAVQFSLQHRFFDIDNPV